MYFFSAKLPCQDRKTIHSTSNTKEEYMTWTVVVAPSGFKESLSANQAAEAIGRGIQRSVPDARVIGVPLVDGGEGFSEGIVAAVGGELHTCTVTGPVGQPVQAHFGILDGPGPRTAVLEMAAAAGLRLVPRDQRNPLLTTTYGVGELIRLALDAGAERILVGCGDSGTNDGGAGMAQALGARLLQADGAPIGRGGVSLAELDRIDVSELDPRLKNVEIDVPCNIHNLLCGPKGVARVFGPQKGASPENVATLEQALERYAAVIARDLGHDVREMPGGGASGGLGTGLHALLGAKLYSRWDVVFRYLRLDEHLAAANLVITAEGSLDFQTPHGKVPAEVARRAKAYQLPVVAIAGTLGRDVEVVLDSGIDAFESMLPGPASLEHAIANAEQWLEDSAARIMRQIMVGQKLSLRQQEAVHAAS
jgi:glycerate kinase